MRLLTTIVAATLAVNINADENLRFNDLIAEQWTHTLQQNPVMASMHGDKSANGEWGDMSLAAQAAENKHNKAYLAALEAIDADKLTSENRLNLELAIYVTQDRLRAYDEHSHLLPLTMREGPQTLYDTAAYLNFAKATDYSDWIKRLENLPAYLEDHQELMAAGLAKGVVQPCIVMSRVVDQLAAIQVDDAAESDFYQPFLKLDDSKIANAAELKRAAKEAISDHVLPAYAQFSEFFNNEYLPSCRKAPGVGINEAGKAYYRYLAEHYTTTKLSPEEIHQVGLDEVARIRKEMKAVMSEVEFSGTLHEFFDYLRTDPQFYYETPQELMNAYLATSKRLDPELVKLFGHLPRTPYGVRAIPDAIAPDTTTAYYMPLAADGSRAGYYYVNLYKPESRPKWEIEVLSVHEAVPGHHLQIAIATEQENLPPFRKAMGVGAYVEGWGLYSERLGYAMGLYTDPYSKFGQLTYDMWRSVRLVVDTGIHYFGWSREKAINYFIDNAPKSKLDIVNEIDRYIGWPGQALGYKIGQLKILELRAKAEESLGDAFDIRAFHDHLLATGAVPLEVMERRMLAWIDAQK